MKLLKCAKYSTESMRRGQNGVANAMFLCLMSSVFFLFFFKKYVKKPLQVFLWQVLMSLVARLASG